MEKISTQEACELANKVFREAEEKRRAEREREAKAEGYVKYANTTEACLAAINDILEPRTLTTEEAEQFRKIIEGPVSQSVKDAKPLKTVYWQIVGDGEKEIIISD